MKKLLLSVTVIFMLQQSIAQNAPMAKNPIVITGHLIRVTKPLRDFGESDKLIPDVKVRDEDGIIGKDEAFEEGTETPQYGSSNNFAEDPALQKALKNEQLHTINNLITAGFNGIGYQPLNPPDPTMCVGPNHIIQMVNGSSGALFQIYNKSGAILVASNYMDAITGKGGLGDPIALYDQLADRYIMTEFNNKAETTTEGLTFAISQTNDPTGAWYVYFFSTGTTFPDYPKFSVWTDAYYATTNDFANGSSYAGSTAYAFDRTKMLAGNATATMQKFTLGNTNKFFSMSPVCIEGTNLPPAGTGGLIAYMADDIWTASATDLDSIGILEFKVNFTTPSLSTVSTKSSLAVTAFKSDICTTTRGQCISQPGSTVSVEALHEKIMNQPVYRNFAGYEGIVLSHVVDKGANISGVRWYELRKTTGNWGVYQQSTYSPDNTHRWLPGICYDAAGNIGLAYNVASSATGVFAGARYSGRKECDALNTMTYAESVLIAGSAANGSTRYGDYNHLVCDPDGVRFWFVCEYNATSQWSTRISSFSLDNCGAVTCSAPAALAASAVTTTSATVSWGAVSGAVSYDVDYKTNASATWINAATATTTTSVNLSGLTAATLYDYRVRTNCAGGSSIYTAAQFTTTSATPTCATAFEPNETQAAAAAITSGVTNSAAITTTTDVDYFKITTTATSNNTFNLVGPSGVDYDLYIYNSAGTQIGSSTGTTATEAVSLTSQAAGIYYIKVLGYNGANSPTCYTIKATAATVTGCQSTYDNSTNGTTSGAATIPFNTNITGLISPSGDIDNYKFVITTAGTITVTLGTLPGDYDLKLLNSAGTQVGISQNGSTTSETISYTAAAGTYYAQAYGYNGANSATVCYTLKVQLGTASQPELTQPVTMKGMMKVYPNPVTNILNISVLGDIDSKGVLTIADSKGAVVMREKIIHNPQAINISRLAKGVYLMKINNGANKITAKFVKE